MKRTLNIILSAGIFVSVCLCGHAQSLDQSKTFYNEGNYAAAKPGFEKLVKQSPNNSSYNQWYGVCCYETGDYENAEKHLLIANKSKIMESYRYLAMIYAQTEQYDNAITMWEGYIEMQKKEKVDISDSENNLEQVRKFWRMMENTEDVQVIDSMVVDKNDFLKAYPLSTESGSLTTYNAFFNSSKNISSVVYQNQKGNKIFYARPSDNQTYSLFSQNRLLETFGDERLLLSTPAADDNYPFVLSDGVTMYFASKGYGSIGGYDIFVTRYNLNTNTFLAPEQLGMPFNSSANDYMMVIDETKGLGWFVTDRRQPDDKVCVYLFIPEGKKRRIDVEAPDILKVRATLSSIAETWKEGANYSALIQLAHKSDNQNNNGQKRDFTFIVNDNTVYYTLDEIKNDGTKDLYAGYLEMTKQVESLQKKINDLRDSYAKGSTAQKEQLSGLILNAEKSLRDLTEQARIQEKKARNAENRKLGVKY
ncbi:MAG: tetratricopeptide repeat protein [Tannerella sp.]|jgi:TolA-binding protein|nr:tetratricopeptide repeat protein [Tannerella sp.]